MGGYFLPPTTTNLSLQNEPLKSSPRLGLDPADCNLARITKTDNYFAKKLDSKGKGSSQNNR